MKKGKYVFLFIIFFSFFLASNPGKEVRCEMKLTSPSFENQKEIPKKFTCDGEDISPELTWSGAPEGTKSFVLVIEDPDAPDPSNPKMTWVHWVLYNIPSTTDSLPEGVSKENYPSGTQDGLNDWKRTGYGGPCPPIGKHRYFHKLYAIDTALPDLRNPPKDKLINAMEGHILAQVELIGLYSRK